MTKIDKLLKIEFLFNHLNLKVQAMKLIEIQSLDLLIHLNFESIIQTKKYHASNDQKLNCYQTRTQKNCYTDKFL